MSGEQPTKAKLVDDQAVPSLRTGNHDRRPRSLLPTGNTQSANWDTSQPIVCLIKAPAPPSGPCTPSQQQQQHDRQLNSGPPPDQTLNPAAFYTTSVQYANVTPNRACSMLVDWEKPEETKKDERQPSFGPESNSKIQSSNSQMLNVRNPPPELSVSPADTLSKPSSSDNLSAFSPIASLNNEPLNDSSFPRFHSLQHRSRKHRKFKQISPLNSPIWPSSQFDTFNRPSSQPHSPSRCVLIHSDLLTKPYTVGTHQKKIVV